MDSGETLTLSLSLSLSWSLLWSKIIGSEGDMYAEEDEEAGRESLRGRGMGFAPSVRERDSKCLRDDRRLSLSLCSLCSSYPYSWRCTAGTMRLSADASCRRDSLILSPRGPENSYLLSPPLSSFAVTWERGLSSAKKLLLCLSPSSSG
jgi:hypothetical protein